MKHNAILIGVFLKYRASRTNLTYHLLYWHLLSYQEQSDERAAQPWKGIPKDLQCKERLASSFRCTWEAQWLQVRAGEFPGWGLGARDWTECWVPLAVRVVIWKQENIPCFVPCSSALCPATKPGMQCHRQKMWEYTLISECSPDCSDWKTTFSDLKEKITPKSWTIKLGT